MKYKVKNNAQIKIIGRRDSEEPEQYELVTEGDFERVDGEIRFGYFESELTGLDGVRTDFVITENGTILLERSGNVSSHMVFEEGKKHYTMYETPYGAISMGVSALEAAVREEDGEINVAIRYIIDVDSSEISRNSFEINVREV